MRSVIVFGYSKYLFLEALGLRLYSQEAKSIDSVEKFYFPNMSSIYFMGTTFLKSDIKLLTDYLIQRSEFGARFEKVSFDKDCADLDISDIHSLSQLVDEIHWDRDKQ